MKKIIMLIFAFIFLVMPVKVYADSASVEVKVNGEVKKGSTIEILVNVKDVEKFYAASVDFTYDVNQLKVQSINASEFITEHSNDIMELGGETDKNGNTASYSFTFLGEKEGIKGSGTLAVITAQVLNNENLSIGQNNMKVKLVQRVGETVENYSYKFNGYNNSAGTNTPDSSDNGSNNRSNDGESIGNDKSESVNNNSTSNNTGDSNHSENDINGDILNSNAEDDNNNNLDNKEKEREDGSAEVSVNENSNSNETANTQKSYKEVTGKSTLTNKNSNTAMIVISAIIVIAAIGGMGYYLYLKNSKKE